MPTATALTSGNSTVNGTTFTTASITPAANALMLAFIYHIDTVSPVDPGVSCVGNGLTWSPIASVVLDMSEASKEHRLMVWRAQQSTAPSAGTLVFTYTNTQDAAAWSVIQITGVDTTLVNGTMAVASIRQVSLQPSSGTTATTVTPYLGAARSPGNIVVAGFGHNVNEATTPGTGMTELADQANAAPMGLEVSWSNAAYTARPSASWATTTTIYGGVAIEVAAPNNEIFYLDPVSWLYV